jgi:hypothetical protein
MGDGVGAEGCVPLSSTAQVTKVACGKFMCDAQTVTDPMTGLTWQRALPATYDGCSGRYFPNEGVAGDACTWEEAKSYCSHFSAASSGWHLPSKDELSSIVDTTRTRPSIDTEAFPATPPHFFWSSSVYDGASGDAWGVTFNDGSSYHYDAAKNNYRVRCVR